MPLGMTRMCQVREEGIKVNSNLSFALPEEWRDTQLHWKLQEVGEPFREKRRLQFGCLFSMAWQLGR